MKKLAAILLLGIFSFNIFGYQLVASFLENKENETMEQAFDENTFTDQQLITIRQPTNLPYYQNSKSYQRIDGEIEIEGVYYKFVKCRIYNDSLELLCIPNAGKMKIQAAKADFSRLAADFQQSNQKKKSSSDSKSFHKTISEFEEHLRSVNPMCQALPTSVFLLKNSQFVNNLFTRSIEQPPDFCSFNA